MGYHDSAPRCQFRVFLKFHLKKITVKPCLTASFMDVNFIFATSVVNKFIAISVLAATNGSY